MSVHKLEFWADSFHEGNWACEGVAKFLKVVDRQFIDNFIPQYVFKLDESNHLEVTVFGAYGNWRPLPQVVGEILKYGKPDLVVYNPLSNKILLAAEETAAVPTGNQALQRCERIYGSSKNRIPFWYLLSEYGLHVDGGIRRASIWPTVLAFKLSCIQRAPSLVLHYSDKNRPEDYDAGRGYEEFFKTIVAYIKYEAGLIGRESLVPILTNQYEYMLEFVKDQQNNMAKFVPGIDGIHETTPNDIARYVVSDKDDSILKPELVNFLHWGTTSELPENIYNNITPKGTIKYHKFTESLEKLVKDKVAYIPYEGSGSRPQNVGSVEDWINQQKCMFDRHNRTNAIFSLNIDDFPKSSNGGLHVTTAKSICYLVDAWRDVEAALLFTHGRLKGLLREYDTSSKVLVYISNSIKPGRIFGDPYTGQLTAFGNVFAKSLTGKKTRLVMAYYPHQVHVQLFDNNGTLRKNKGVVVMRDLVDVAIFHGGVVVDCKTMEAR